MSVRDCHYRVIRNSGDLYHFAISRQDRRVPKFNVDRDMTLASMDRVEALVQETGATLWIQHELEFFRQLNTAQAYYDRDRLTVKVET